MILELETTNSINLEDLVMKKNIRLLYTNSREILVSPCEFNESLEDYEALQRDAHLIIKAIDDGYAEHLI